MPDALLWPALVNLLAPPPTAQILTVALSRNEVNALPRHVRAPGASLRSTRFSQLRRADLRGAQAPPLVLSPLVRPGFDSMDLLTTLREAGYAGRYLVLAVPVPHLALIRAEMQAVAGALNVDVIALGAGSVLHLV